MEEPEFKGKDCYYEWIDLPNASRAAIAKYRRFSLSHYNKHPIIGTLPPILSSEEFIALAARELDYHPLARELPAIDRFHQVRELDGYFDPLPQTLNLQRTICLLLMRGYVSRNPLHREYAKRSTEIYKAIVAKDGRNLENYVSAVSKSASGLTIIGESGIGKSTNITRILDIYPQVVFHPEYSFTQIVWLKVDCPHSGSLKGLCQDIFQAIDKLLGTNNSKKFGSRNNSEDYMLGQVAQLAHTHHLGLLVIDEMQNLTNAKRRVDDLLNFLVKMDNTIGIPVIRVGTPEAVALLSGNFRNARRATGIGAIRWKPMTKGSEEWDFFVEGLWRYQWTKTEVPYSQEMSEAFFDETQGIIDIVIKLYQMVQWTAIAKGGSEAIDVNLIHQVAREGFYFIKPMLDAIRSGDIVKMQKYRDISAIDISEHQEKYLDKLHSRLIARQRHNRANRDKEAILSLTGQKIAIELMQWTVGFDRAKEVALQVVAENPHETDFGKLFSLAYNIASEVSSSKTVPERGKSRANLTNSLNAIVEAAQTASGSAYNALVEANIVKDSIAADFLD